MSQVVPITDRAVALFSRLVRDDSPGASEANIAHEARRRARTQGGQDPEARAQRTIDERARQAVAMELEMMIKRDLDRGIVGRPDEHRAEAVDRAAAKRPALFDVVVDANVIRGHDARAAARAAAFDEHDLEQAVAMAIADEGGTLTMRALLALGESALTESTAPKLVEAYRARKRKRTLPRIDLEHLGAARVAIRNHQAAAPSPKRTR